MFSVPASGRCELRSTDSACGRRRRTRLPAPATSCTAHAAPSPCLPATAAGPTSCRPPRTAVAALVGFAQLALAVLAIWRVDGRDHLHDRPALVRPALLPAVLHERLFPVRFAVVAAVAHSTP